MSGVTSSLEPEPAQSTPERSNVTFELSKNSFPNIKTASQRIVSLSLAAQFAYMHTAFFIS